ncbi:hypothetical protein [Pseudacidovorax sp. RU35E]|nr:hypothetical protein [Pseudacidovorax sp. RU35E]
MAEKEQKRGNRELKKPKKKPASTVPTTIAADRTPAPPARVPKKS